MQDIGDSETRAGKLSWLKCTQTVSSSYGPNYNCLFIQMSVRYCKVRYITKAFKVNYEDLCRHYVT